MKQFWISIGDEGETNLMYLIKMFWVIEAHPDLDLPLFIATMPMFFQNPQVLTSSEKSHFHGPYVQSYSFGQKIFKVALYLSSF